MGLRQDSILLRPSSRPKVLESYVSKYNNLYFKYFYFYSKNSIICIINIIIFIIIESINMKNSIICVINIIIFIIIEIINKIINKFKKHYY
jgi:hypothetical protein